MKNLDASLDYMENARFNYLYAPIVLRMEKTSQFQRCELLSLVLIYHKFVLENGSRAKYMTTVQLSRMIEMFFHISDREINAIIVSRISRYDDTINDPKFTYDRYCSLVSFIRLFSIYFSESLDLRMQFAFSVYDTTERGCLDREVVTRWVDKFFEGDDEDEIFELRTDMTEVIFMKFDLDRDMVISEEEYFNVVREQPALIEFLGRVFPSTRDLDVIAMCSNILSFFDRTGHPLADEL
ncbi:uncharacterized protein LOC115634239 [Scaptodrosophila lebanonensis]|uniref:Uncharacterized protein LOC115634239 n=1 Tax=Drosophila lebanonensis TaxID=7225 RepID=A0A6J2UJL7_DROLE|nr:uncharacterized protein LOC115634239 [Scaptodrosophila lebanonensis]